MNKLLEEMMIESTEGISSAYYIPTQYFQKFAELIVQECLNILDVECGLEQKILEHFGIDQNLEIR